ncbi:hypothetical protein ZHAS_00005277 [Anopheles sinensis]|uniref:Uncharacterized protein n=1 Tax=Anopheles sinensis TaxID=74873 RepID=A0A084VJ57_ANOSI|nr:hypothetical protein ZHAS_00005277 [Anopheles sinensis]
MSEPEGALVAARKSQPARLFPRIERRMEAFGRDDGQVGPAAGDTIAIIIIVNTKPQSSPNSVAIAGPKLAKPLGPWKVETLPRPGTLSG